MKISISNFTARVFGATTVILLGVIIYHLSVCPLHQPVPIVLFPTLTLQTNVTYSTSPLAVGDKVFIMKKFMGVVTSTNDLNYHCTVLYLDTKQGKGLPILGKFPYTVLQKISVGE